LSDLSFGMYLVHLFFITLWAGIFIGEGGSASPAVPVYLAIPLIAVCTFICSAITIKIASFIPASKWLVGCGRH
ncbi:MAG: acyltransferase, partial [Bacteroidales bacterium]|nr:acyltransferase [Bacteroidales bacterium]